MKTEKIEKVMLLCFCFIVDLYILSLHFKDD